MPADMPAGVCPQCELQGALDVLAGEATQIDAAQSLPLDATAEVIDASRLDAPPYTPPTLRQFGDYELLEENRPRRHGRRP